MLHLVAVLVFPWWIRWRSTHARQGRETFKNDPFGSLFRPETGMDILGGAPVLFIYFRIAFGGCLRKTRWVERGWEWPALPLYLRFRPQASLRKPCG